MNKKTLLLLIGLGALLGVKSQAEEPPPAAITPQVIALKERLKAVGCSLSVLAQLREWKSKDQWTQHFSSLNSAESFHSPTENFGSWIEIRFHPDNTVSLLRFSAHSREQTSWNSDCSQESQKKTIPPPSAAPKQTPAGFTDEELQGILQTIPSGGVLYVWSPHMPCSVKGLHAILQTTQAMGLKLIPLLDPASNLPFARRLANQEKFPPEALRPVLSLELILRGLTNYAPSLQVFSKGALSGPIFRGYQNDTNYQRFIQPNL